jgi:outer membrane protein OmpA-like peptidoglycan-associated protein
MRRSRSRPSLALVVLVAPIFLSVSLSVSLTRPAQAQTGPDDEPLPPAFAVPPAQPVPPRPAEVPGTPAPSPPSPPPSPSPSLAPSSSPSTPSPAEPEGAIAGPVPASFLPSLVGPIGLYHLSTAEVGPVDHLRLALHGQFFRASDFLVQDDEDTRLSGDFSFGFTPHEYLELFGAMLTSSNRNERPPEANRRDPVLIKSFGDLIVGGKGVYPVARGFTLGGELGLLFLSAISDLAISPSSTSLWIGPLATYDFRPDYGIPLRLHANLSFYLDNSKNLYDFSGTTAFTHEVAMFAYGIAESRFRFALGVDTPLEQLTAPVPIQLFAEYHLEIATGSSDPAFAGFGGQTNRDQQWVTFGLRARVFHGLTLDAGFDAAVQSVGYGYGPPLPPYNVIFGIGFPLDVDAFKRPVVVTRTLEKENVPTTGTVSGTVKAASDGKPIGDAVVAFIGQARARVASDPDGSFVSGPLPPGPVDLEVTAAGFESMKLNALVAAGGSAPIEFSLKAKIVSGNVRGKVADGAGHGLGATVRFIGGTTSEAQTDLGGLYTATLPAGPYRVTVAAPGFPSKEAPLDVVAGQDQQLDVTLRPANPDVTLTAQAIVLRIPIKFRAGKPKLTPVLKAELEGVAEVLADHREIKTLRIEAHWTGTSTKSKSRGKARGKGKGKATAGAVGTGAQDKALTERQAALVKDYLASKGVPAERIEAVGLGAENPLVPNLGPASQKKNRRVELIVVQQL